MGGDEGIGCHEVIFSGHALVRMFERSISREDVLAVLEFGEVIADYPDDTPLPSCLMLGFVAGRPIHVVVATEKERKLCIIITAYIPDPILWNAEFRKRKSP